RGIDGLSAAVDRVKAMVDAGADAIFPEAMKDLSEFESITNAVDVPVLANMTEFGKSELFNRQQLADAGVAMVIYPVTLLRSAMGEAERDLETITKDGTHQADGAQMLTRSRMSELGACEEDNAFESGIFNIEVVGLNIDANAENL